MKSMVLLVLLFLVTGCANMTPREKQTAWIVGGIVVGAAVIAAGGSSDSSTKERCYTTAPVNGVSLTRCD